MCLQSALDQAAVERMAAEDRQRADAHASAVARRAVSALRASQAECAQFDVSQPTWTGRSGSAGGPPVWGRGGRRFGRSSAVDAGVGSRGVAGARPGLPGMTGTMSSAQVLQRLRQVQDGCLPGNASTGDTTDSGTIVNGRGTGTLEEEAAPASEEDVNEQLETLKQHLMTVFSASRNQGLTSTDVVRSLSVKIGTQSLQNFRLLRQALETVASERRLNGQVKWFSLLS